MALQKNPGPLLTSWFKGLVDHISPEWRARLGLKKRDQQEPVDVDPDAIAGVLVNSEVNQTRTDERKKTDVELATDPAGVFLLQQKRLSNGQIVTEAKSFVPEGTPLATDVETIEGEQRNLGIGWMENSVTEADLPGPTVESSEIDHDGVVVKVYKTRRLRSTITESEQLVSGVWAKITTEGETDLVATEVIRARTIPGVPMDTTRLDEDGVQVTTRTTYKETTTIETKEEMVGSVWVKTHIATCSSIMGPSDLVSDEVVEARVLPGNPIPSTKLDKDGVMIETVKTLKLFTTITTQETLTGGFWVKVTADQVTELVSWEVVELRAIPGNTITAAAVDGDQEVQNITTLIRDESVIAPISEVVGAFIHTIEKRPMASDLVAEQVTTNTKWLDKALFSQRLPENIIPLEFRAQIPTVVESHVVPGDAAMPVLTGSQIFAQEHQLTLNLKEVRTESFGLDLTFPVDQLGYELTEEYGGGVLVIQRRLHNVLMTVDQGEDVVRSKVDPIGEDLMWFRETARRYIDTEWPELVGTEVDPRTGIVVEVRKQVVDAGTEGGIVGDEYTDVKSIDKWRSLQIVSKLDPDSLPSPVIWETTIEHSFPNVLVAASFVYGWASAPFAYDFDLSLITEIHQGYAGPCRAKITEDFFNGAPPDVVTVTKFFPQAHSVGFAWGYAADPSEDCGSCVGIARTNARTFSIPPCLHDAIDLAFGVVISGGTVSGTLPATDPIALPATDTLIVKDVNIERWRFGIFFRRMTEIYVP